MEPFRGGGGSKAGYGRGGLAVDIRALTSEIYP